MWLSFTTLLPTARHSTSGDDVSELVCLLVRAKVDDRVSVGVARTADSVVGTGESDEGSGTVHASTYDAGVKPTDCIAGGDSSRDFARDTGRLVESGDRRDVPAAPERAVLGRDGAAIDVCRVGLFEDSPAMLTPGLSCVNTIAPLHAPAMTA